MATLTINDLRKSYGAVPAVKGVSLGVADREFVALVGPSGCGKSTLLRMIAGLETITSGTISIDGDVINEVEPSERGIAMVFQNYALYPHMNVAKNMSFALRVAGRPQAEIDARVKDAARILRLDGLLDRRPADLSGGQRQRVAMGRAIVRRPAVFLFDEPLSNLDAKLRTEMRAEIRRIHRDVGATTVYVTHDQIEAMTLADRIVLMRDGLIEQMGTPQDLFERPATEFVAAFIGSPPMNLVPATVTAGGVGLDDGLVVPVATQGLAVGRKVTFGLRPDDIAPEGHGIATGAAWSRSAAVSAVEPLGAESLIVFPFGGRDWTAKMLRPRPVALGETLSLRFDLTRAHLFDRDTAERLNQDICNGGD
jgi:multiple sugar transport system ATP-binding protein